MDTTLGAELFRHLIAGVFVLPILAIIDGIVLLISYTTLQVMRIPVHWPTLLIGYGLSALMLWGLWLVFINPAFDGRYIAWSSLSGALAFIVSVFAVAQWPQRHWYVRSKRWLGNWIVRPSRNFFLYLRDHHNFFGWLTLLAATIHTVILFPILGSLSTYEVWTGVVALIALAAQAATGEWIAHATRTKRLSTQIRWLHLALMFTFIVAFAFHV